jgi:prophage regulatory protein
MRLLNFPDLRLAKGIAYTRRHLKRKCDSGNFPRPIQVSDRRIAWIEEEVDAWLAARVAERDKNTAA